MLLGPCTTKVASHAQDCLAAVCMTVCEKIVRAAWLHSTLRLISTSNNCGGVSDGVEHVDSLRF